MNIRSCLALIACGLATGTTSPAAEPAAAVTNAPSRFRTVLVKSRVAGNAGRFSGVTEHDLEHQLRVALLRDARFRLGREPDLLAVVEIVNLVPPVPARIGKDDRGQAVTLRAGTAGLLTAKVSVQDSQGKDLAAYVATEPLRRHGGGDYRSGVQRLAEELARWVGGRFAPQ